jgi:hypothetical protein
MYINGFFMNELKVIAQGVQGWYSFKEASSRVEVEEEVKISKIVMFEH